MSSDGSVKRLTLSSNELNDGLQSASLVGLDGSQEKRVAGFVGMRG